MVRIQIILIYIVATLTLIPTTAGIAGLDVVTSEDVLWHDDVVIRGPILSVDDEQVLAQEFVPELQMEGLFSIVRVRIDVQEVMRGRIEKGECDVYIGGSGEGDKKQLLLSFQPGSEVIVTGSLRSYQGRRHVGLRGAFVYDHDGWREWRRRDWLNPAPLESVRSRVQGVSVDAVTRRSGLIVSGAIVAADTIEYVPTPGNGYAFIHYVVQVREVLKGTAPDTILVVSVSQGVEGWATRIPFEMNIGEAWYLFLRPRTLPETGDRTIYTTTAGRWSAYLVSGDNLLERRELPSAYTVQLLESDVKAARE